MNKEQFKNLDILAQIEYVNNILKEGKTLARVKSSISLQILMYKRGDERNITVILQKVI